jgi:hypothetical protein
VIVGVIEDTNVIAGGMYLPGSDLLYLAARGSGATRNGAPIEASNTLDLSDAVVDHSLAQLLEHDTFPGEVFLELAADTLDEGGISRDQPVDNEGIRERYLPEHQFRGRTEHDRSHYALRAVAMIRSGVTPDLLDEVGWWDTNGLWVWSLYALLIYVRVAAERAGDPVAVICQLLAERHGVELAEA